MVERNLWLIVQAAGIVDTFPSTTVHAGSILVIGLQQSFFHIPMALLCADAELEIFFRDTVPVLEGKLASSDVGYDWWILPCKPS